jgi:UDP-3-O-[3-hydroxymyristoyl] glucosamine N-acyltransferase
LAELIIFVVMKLTLQEIASIIHGTIQGDPTTVILGPAKIEEAGEGSITFLANPKYAHYVNSTKASALICQKDTVVQNHSLHLVMVDNVYLALGQLLQYYNEQTPTISDIASTASIHPSAQIGDGVAIDAYAVIGPNVVIGAGTKIHAHVVIGAESRVGSHCVIYPSVVVYHQCEIGNNVVIQANAVIGSDGFGFANNAETGYEKIPQIGNVVIEDHVEIGSGTIIDRASIGSTIIRKGAKLDNLIQIAHNVEIGEKTAIAAQTGIAGSTKVGRSCVFGGQVGIAGHINIADGTMVQAKSGISSSVKEAGSKLYGYPALEYGQYLKSYAYFKRLPELAQKISELEKEIEKLSNLK